MELTFPGANDQPPPSLETLTAINVRSSVDLAGDLSFGDEMLQKVHVSVMSGTIATLWSDAERCCQQSCSTRSTGSRHTRSRRPRGLRSCER